MKKTTIILLILILFISTNGFINAKSFDHEIRKIVLENKTPLLSKTMDSITLLGNGSIDLIIASSIPDEKAREDAFKSLFVGGIASISLKYVIGQVRPYASDGTVSYKPFTMDDDYHAMPSGHTTTAFALATIITDHYPEHKKLVYTLATLVGISRVYKDVHWTSNVIAGAGLGYLSAKFVQIKW